MGDAFSKLSALRAPRAYENPRLYGAVLKKINIQLRTGDRYIRHEKQELNLPWPQLVTKQHTNT